MPMPQETEADKGLESFQTVNSGKKKKLVEFIVQHDIVHDNGANVITAANNIWMKSMDGHR